MGKKLFAQNTKPLSDFPKGAFSLPGNLILPPSNFSSVLNVNASNQNHRHLGQRLIFYSGVENYKVLYYFLCGSEKVDYHFTQNRGEKV
jgi:hypothetical protein